MSELISKYQKGKIYKIVDSNNEKCYYGSTIQKLNIRFNGHKNSYIYDNRKKSTSKLLFDEFGIENCRIELVELYPCNSIKELNLREGYYIKNNECVNKNIAGRSLKEYRSENKEKISNWHKIHYNNNKERIDAKNMEHYLSNKEHYNKKRNELYYKKHAENLEKNRQYREKNREILNEKQRLKRMEIKNKNSLNVI